MRGNRAVPVAVLTASRAGRGFDLTALGRALRASVVVVLLAVMVSACAESVTAPTVVQAIAPETKAGVRVADVTAEATPGVPMTRYDFDRITARVKAEIAGTVPGALVEGGPAAGPPRAGSTIKINLVFTRYDGGNAFARFLLAGLGQIHVEADVIFLDAGSGEAVAKYQIAKDFSFGGIYGATTRIEDVEIGFAKSVAEILRDKPGT